MPALHRNSADHLVACHPDGTDAYGPQRKTPSRNGVPDGASRVSGRIKMTLRKRQGDPTIAPGGNNPRF
jgi:hypothetical protein